MKLVASVVIMLSLLYPAAGFLVPCPRISRGSTALNYHILLVDDEEPLRRAVGALLRDRGHTVEAKASGAEALEYVALPSHAEAIDVIVSDISMRKMDGFQLLKNLQAQEALIDTPVIFLSARGMTPDRIAGYKAGANAYLTKPFDPEELMSIIDNLVSANEKRKERGMQGIEMKELLTMKQDLGDIKDMIQQQAGKLMVPSSRLKGSTAGGDENALEAVSLTPKERSVLQLVCQGLTNKEIAAELSTTQRGVEKHVSNLLGKTQSSNRTELVRLAFTSKLIS